MKIGAKCDPQQVPDFLQSTRGVAKLMALLSSADFPINLDSIVSQRHSVRQYLLDIIWILQYLLYLIKVKRSFASLQVYSLLQ